MHLAQSFLDEIFKFSLVAHGGLRLFLSDRVLGLSGIVSCQPGERLFESLFLLLFSVVVPIISLLHAGGVVEVRDDQVVVLFHLDSQFLGVPADEPEGVR